MPMLLVIVTSVFYMRGQKNEVNAMRIDGPGRIQGLNAYQKASRVEKQDTDMKKKKDEVEISAQAQELLKSGGTKDTDRQQRIEELREQVQSGRYHVKSEDLAAKLLQRWKNEKL